MLSMVAILLWLFPKTYSVTANVHLEPSSSLCPISIMTFNIENGGAQVDFKQTIKVIQQSHADVVGIQEAWGNLAVLARALGWRYYHPQQHIISRYPLYVLRDHKQYTTLVEVRPKQFIAVANVHLPDEHYGPDLIHSHYDVTSVEAAERRTRLPVALPYIDELDVLSQRGMPVFLTGDFNSPSILDWTVETVHLLANHRYVVRWPVTAYLAKKKFIDSYRFLHPSPITYPGYTWPALRPMVDSIDHFNPAATDLKERLDFVFSKGAVQVLESTILGEKGKLAVTPWPSDHRAVVSRFLVEPQLFFSPNLVAIQPEISSDKAKITVSNKEVHSGTPFSIHWVNAPGNRFDYIRISPVKSKKLAWGEAVRLYTFAQKNGNIEYNETNKQGNWLLWHKGEEGHWPLRPGVYAVTLMLDDGFVPIAQTQIKVSA